MGGVERERTPSPSIHVTGLGGLRPNPGQQNRSRAVGLRMSG